MCNGGMPHVIDVVLRKYCDQLAVIGASELACSNASAGAAAGFAHGNCTVEFLSHVLRGARLHHAVVNNIRHVAFR
jgi:hypothetical protein